MVLVLQSPDMNAEEWKIWCARMDDFERKPAETSIPLVPVPQVWSPPAPVQQPGRSSHALALSSADLGRTSIASFLAQGDPKAEEPKIEEPKVEELFEPQVVEEAEEPKIEEPVFEPQVEQSEDAHLVEACEGPETPQPSVITSSWLTPLMHDDLHDAVLPPADYVAHDPVLEAALGASPQVAGAILDLFEAEDRNELICKQAVWQALAPAPAGEKSSPRWFPGTFLQYVSVMRAFKNRSKMRCLVSKRFVEFWLAAELAQQEVEREADHVEVIARIDEAEASINDHTSRELQKYLGPAPGETHDQAIKRTQLQLSALRCMKAQDIGEERRAKAAQPKKKHRAS